VQPDWVVVYRFDTIANVSTWINSATRQERLAVGQQFLLDEPREPFALRGGGCVTRPGRIEPAS